MKKICFFLLIFSVFVTYKNKIYAAETDEYEAAITSGSIGILDYRNGEVWNPLAVVNGIPQLSHPIDYSEEPGLLKYLKKGDIIFEDRGEAYGVTHLAIVVDIMHDETYDQDFVLIIEAVNCGVCYGVVTPNRFNAQGETIKRITNATEAQIDAAIEWIKLQINKPYNINIQKSSSPDNPDWYCSELIWAGFYNQGIDLDSENGVIIQPKSIIDYKYAYLVMEYGQETTYTKVNNGYHSINCNGSSFQEAHDYFLLNKCMYKCETCDYEYQYLDHVYDYRFSTYNAYQHKTYCECGTYTTEGHNFVESMLRRICSDCGYSELINHFHLYLYIPCNDGMNHTKSCTCGLSFLELCESEDSTICDKCGQDMEGNDIIVMVIGENTDNAMILSTEKKEDEESMDEK